tara:strand:+ start:229 stop:453 length:225 start_codon:yes stop_codon:yes gene_type:complete
MPIQKASDVRRSPQRGSVRMSTPAIKTNITLQNAIAIKPDMPIKVAKNISFNGCFDVSFGGVNKLERRDIGVIF